MLPRQDNNTVAIIRVIYRKKRRTRNAAKKFLPDIYVEVFLCMVLIIGACRTRRLVKNNTVSIVVCYFIQINRYMFRSYDHLLKHFTLDENP
jgi:hypothetical protein